MAEQPATYYCRGKQIGELIGGTLGAKLKAQGCTEGGDTYNFRQGNHPCCKACRKIIDPTFPKGNGAWWLLDNHAVMSFFTWANAEDEEAHVTWVQSKKDEVDKEEDDKPPLDYDGLFQTYTFRVNCGVCVDADCCVGDIIEQIRHMMSSPYGVIIKDKNDEVVSLDTAVKDVKTGKAGTLWLQTAPPSATTVSKPMASTSRFRPY